MPKNLPNRPIKENKLVPISVAADFLDVSIDTVRRWDKLGKLHSIRPNGKDRLFSLSELQVIKSSEPLSITEVAEKFQLSVSTLRRLEKKNIIKPKRDENGVRLYDDEVINNFLKSDYYLGKSKAPEIIPEILQEAPQVKVKVEPIAPVIPSLRQPAVNETEYQRIVDDVLKEQSKKISQLNHAKKIIMSSVAFIATTSVLLVSLITIFFLLFPREASEFFGYNYGYEGLAISSGSKALLDNEQGVLGVSAKDSRAKNPLGSALKPFSTVSLRLVKNIDPDIYQQVVPQKAIEDVNDIFAVNEAGELIVLYDIQFPDNVELKFSRPESLKVENVDAVSVLGRVPGSSEGNLAVFGADGTIAGLTVTESTGTFTLNAGDVTGGVGGLILDGSIVTEDLADESITVDLLASDSVTSEKIEDETVATEDLADEAVTSAKIKDGAVTASQLAASLTFSDGDFLNLSAILHNDSGLQGLILPNVSSSSPTSPTSGEGYLAYDTSGNQVIVFNGSAWVQVGSGDITGVIVGNGLSGGGLSGDLSINLDVTTSSTTVTTSSNSGLEVNSDGLSLLRGCSDNQIIKWDAGSGVWQCESDSGGGGSLDIEENNSLVVSAASSLDFLGSDFSVTNSPSGEANVSIDYSNSKIVRSDQTETISAGWTFSSTIDSNGNLSIADTDIVLDGASTNFTSTGDISFNTNDIFIDKDTGRVGIGTTQPSTALEVSGTTTATTFADGTATLSSGVLDLGTNTFYDGNLTGNWAFNSGNATGINNISAGGTVTFSGIGTGTDNSVLIVNGSGSVLTDEIDSRVWGSSLVDYSSSSAGYVSLFSDTDTVSNSSIFESGGSIGIGTTAPTDVLHVAGPILATGGLHIGVDSTDTLIDDASSGSGSTTLYIGNESILVSGDIGTSVQGYSANTTILGSSISLADEVTGTLDVDSGGTGVATITSNGILYGNGTGAIQATAAGTNGYILYSNNGTPAWLNPTSLNAGQVDGLEGTDFLRANANDEFETGNTLTFTGAIDSNGNLSIADTDIALDGASTNFAATGNLSINTDDLVVEKSSGYIGVGTTNPSYNLDVAGSANLLGFYLSSVEITSTATEINLLDGRTGTLLDTNNVAATLSAWDQNSSDDVTTSDIGVSVQAYNANTSVLGSSIDTSEITNDSILEIDLDATNAPTDDYILTFDNASGGFTWVDPSTIGGSIDGSGTAGYTALWSDGDTLASSSIYETGGQIGIGTTSPSSALHVIGAVTVSTNIDAGGTIQAGSGNITLTDSTGYVLHDSLVDCADGQILKWTTGGGRWGCDTDETGGGGGSLDTAYNSGGTVTVDAYDVLFDLNDATNDYGVVIDNNTTGVIATALEFTTAGVGGTFTTAIDASDDDIVTALAIGTNTITTGATTIASTELDLLDGGITLGELTDSGTFTATTVDINGGAIDGTAIGANSASSGAFTTLSSNNTVTFSGLGTGTDNSVVVVNGSNQLVTDEIDSRVWGSTLLDYSTSTAGYISKFSDADTATNSVIYETSGNIGIGTTAPTDVLQVAGQVFATTGFHVGVDSDNNLIDDASNGAGSTTLYIGNESILASGDIGTSIQGYNANTTVLGSSIGNSELDNDTVDFDKIANSLTLDEETTIAAGGALNLLIGNNVTFTTTGTGAIIATDLSCTNCIGATEISDLTLGTDTAGNYVASFTAGSGLTGDGSGEGSTPTIAVGQGTGITVGTDDISVNQATAFTWTSDHTWTLAETEDLSVALSISGTNAGQGQIVTITNSSDSGNQYGIVVDNAASTGTTESLLRLDNSDTNTAVTNAIEFVDGGGTFTNLFNVNGTAISTSEFTVLSSGIALSELTDSGTFTATTVDINGGAIDGTTVGASSASTGAFTTLSSNNTVTFSGLGTGTDNSVVVVNGSNQLVTDEIDARVWGSTLLDYATSTAGYISKFSDADTATNSVIYETGGAIGIGTTAPTDVLHVTGQVLATTGFHVGADGDGTLIDDSSNGASSTTLYIGNESILASGDIGVSVQGYNASTTVLGASIGNSELDNDTVDFDKIANSLTLDEETTIAAGGALNLLIGNNVTFTTTGTGAITATDLSCTNCIGATEISDLALGTDTSGDYVASFTAGNGLTGDGSGEGSTPTIAIGQGTGITVGTDDISVNQATSFTWTSDHTWNLAETEDLSVALSISGTSAGQGQLVTITNSSDSGNQYGIVVDNAASSGTTESLLRLDNSDTDTAVTNGIEFVDAGGTFTNLFNVNGTAISTSEFTVLSSGIALSELTNSGTLTATTVDINGGAIDGTIIGGSAAAAGTFTQATITTGALAVNAGSITSDDATLTINAAGAVDIQDAVTVDSLNIDTGNLDVAGTIQAGSGNITLTDSTGYVLHDSLVDCADGQVLKWATGGGRWGCDTDETTGGGGSLDTAYNSGGTITVDAYDVLFDLNDATNDYGVVIDNNTTGEIATALEFTTAGVGGTFVTAIDASDGDIGTALAIGANNITTAATTIASTELDLLDGGITLGELTDSGTFTATTVDINGGALDGTTVGANSASSGAFTTLSSTSTVTFSGLGTGTDNSVVILNGSNQLTTDEIDARVWGTSLVDFSSTAANYVPLLSDADTIINSSIYETGGAIGIGTTAPTDVLHVTGQVLATTGFHVGVDSTNNLIDDASNGSGSTTLYIGNESILASGDIGASVQGYNANTTVLGASIGNSELDNDTIDFDKIANSLTLDEETTISAGGALNLLIGNNVTFTTTGTGAITATDLSCTNCIGATEISDLALGTDTSGNYVASFTAGSGLTGDGSGEGSTPTIAVGQGTGITVGTDDISVNQATAFTWTSDHTWTLAETEDLSVALSISGTNAGQGQIVTITNSSDSGNQYGIVVDNAASTGTTESLLRLDNSDTNTAVTNGIEFVDAGGTFTNLFNVNGTVISTAEFTVLSSGIALSELTNSGTLTATTVDINGGAIDGVTIGGSAAGAATFTQATITTGALAVNAGSITSDDATLTINAGGTVDIQDALVADSLSIDTGNLDVAGTIQAGSGNINLTDSTGYVLHDALVDCADTQVLKWATGGGRWGCATDETGGSSSLDDAYNNGATITVDAADILLDLNDATNDYGLVIDNNTTGAIATALEFTTAGVGGTFATAIDASDADIVDALNVGANNITGAGYTITATGSGLTINSTSANLAFTTTTSGDITFTPSSATALVNVLTGNLKIGNGTPDVTQNGEDAYIEGTLEVDSAVTFDNGLTITSGALAINSDSITADGAVLTINAGGTVDIQDALSVSGGLSGVTTLTSSGDWTWSATTPTISINATETFTVSDGTDTFAINTSGSSFSFSDGTNSFTFDVDTGPVYAGNARPARTLILSPEYAGAVLTAYYGSGTDTNITGTMTSDTDTTQGTTIRNYYSWERASATQHFYTVAVRVTLPADFAAWATTNALQVSYITENATSTNSDLDVYIYNENSATIVGSSVDNASTSWTTVTVDDSTLDDGAGSEWDAAGETAVIYLRMGSQSGNFVHVGDIVLNYLAKN